MDTGLRQGYDDSHAVLSTYECLVLDGGMMQLKRSWNSAKIHFRWKMNNAIQALLPEGQFVSQPRGAGGTDGAMEELEIQ